MKSFRGSGVGDWSAGGTECGGDVLLMLQSFVPGFQVVLIGGVICGLGLQQFAG